jgi:hypothetical protein
MLMLEVKYLFEISKFWLSDAELGYFLIRSYSSWLHRLGSPAMSILLTSDVSVFSIFEDFYFAKFGLKLTKGKFVAYLGFWKI